MAIDQTLYYAQATRGEVAGVALAASGALFDVVYALQNIRDGNDATEQIKQVREAAQALQKMFDELIGFAE